MGYLDKIDSPENLKELSKEKLPILCNELRQFLIESVSRTGGHLASNLGVVELTVALHYAFSTPKDKIVWDVGHQAYVHKILTGRKKDMSTLRQMNGLSGFPKRLESEYDIFDTGHSSTSVSAAVGLARGRDLKKEKNEVIAVIGDGALTGGMAFEALNDAARSSTKLIIILNDNEMSISENVGGLSQYLSKIRTVPEYIKTKRDVEKVLDRIPGAGKHIKSFLKKLKDGIKQMVVADMFFEDLGFTYVGPVDGHNMEELLETFQNAKTINQPLLIHIVTKKGKGYKFAEKRPNEFHGVSAFNVQTGQSVKKSSYPSYSDIFGEKICEIAQKNENVVAITAAMSEGTGLSKFSQKFKNRYFDVGIAEQHAVTMAAGMAVSGITPVVAIYSSFLQRAYDQIIHDVVLQKLHVVFAIDRAGIVGNDGETHQGLFDSAFLLQIPNMTIMSPIDYAELENMLEFAVNTFDGPIAVRYPRGSSYENLPNSNNKIVYGKSLVVKSGDDISILASGRMVEIALNAAKTLSEKNIDAEVINLRFIKPLDEKGILKSINKTKKVLILDECVEDGSFSLKINEIVPDDVEIYKKTLPNEFIPQGSIDELLKKYKLDEANVAKFVENIFNEDCLDVNEINLKINV